MKEKLILIGNGMAGMRTIEELLALAPQRFDISIFGAEPHGNYNRILLSPLLAGEKTLEDIMLHDLEWYAQRNITLHAGRRAVKIDRRQRQVLAEDGTTLPYDRLLLATGSDPFMIPVPGKDLAGVVTFRDIGDVSFMLEAAASGMRHAVVIGGGLLGLEAANGLAKRGMQVTVVHLLDILMERQLDAAAAGLLRRDLERRGIDFLMGAQTEAILGEKRVTGIRFKTGLEIPADLVVMAAGIRPNTALARDAGLACERGVIVDDTLLTSDPHIYAVGECAQHRGVTYGLVAPLWEQARVCAQHLAGLRHVRYQGSVVSTRLKVSGIDLFSAGDFNGTEDTEEILLRAPSLGVYKKLVIRANRIEGAVLYGDTGDGPWYFQLMQETTDISASRENLIFGKPYASGTEQEIYPERMLKDCA